jgi:CDP-4-dehydro-6-deoxyglucose reductase, E3
VERLGTPIDLHGPYGNFWLPKDAAGPVLCLAGGSGLAPILSIARRALATGFAQPMELILSVRDRSEAFALDALHALARRHANFTYRVSLTRAQEAAPGWRLGRIPDWLPAELPDLSDWHVLAAGPPGFVDACVAEALALGASPGRILTDSFTPTIA